MAALDIKSLQSTIYETAKIIQNIETRYKIRRKRKKYFDSVTCPTASPKVRTSKEFKYTRNFLAAISLLGARKSGWRYVTASAIEINTDNPKISSTITIRLSQNTNQVAPEDIALMQGILNKVVTFVNGACGEDWRSLRGQTKQQYELLSSFGEELLPEIVQHCIHKIATTITQRRVQFSKAWEQVRSRATTSDNLGEKTERCFLELTRDLANFGGNDHVNEAIQCISAAALTTIAWPEATLNKIWQNVVTEGAQVSSSR